MAHSNNDNLPACAASTNPTRYGVKQLSLLAIIALLVIPHFGLPAAAADESEQFKHSDEKGMFLVATEQLAHSSFKETVILITHLSERGATGLAINRPSEFQLNQIFPEVEPLRQHHEDVYLGGPVRTNSVFVLMRTKRPHANMYRIAKDLYFSAGMSALTHGLENLTNGEHTRAYVGYTGWAPGQLQHEINRGDWLVVHADPDIVFDQDYRSVWKKLLKSWSGQWI
ncbi:MAG: YqgE/AlgH family protein [Gammaproteobacteria bacterium]|jgi:putative transcriptional regulator|nr:YqgE/AlgH family protein [Gammaproteobacteria bacterium]